MNVSSTGAAVASRLAAAFLTISVVAVAAQETNELVRIDFRNKVPGVLDAPILDFDGVSGLDSSALAELLVGTSEGSLGPVSPTVQFLSGADAGYLPYEEPQERTLAEQPILGQRIWFLLQIWEWVPRGPFGAYVLAGESKVYSMMVTNHVMPLVGLESFSLVPEQLRITRQGDQAVVQWQYLAAQKYELQTASGLQPPILWSPIFEWSGTAATGQIFSVTNAVTSTAQFYRLERWEWP